MIEPDRLVVFQKHIKLAYVRDLSELLPTRPSEEEIFDFALRSEGRDDRPIQVGPIGQMRWASPPRPPICVCST
jgi:hypothetical protein